MRTASAGIEILLVGNPNAGKSTLFNALTGGHAKVGNWHGVTVGALQRGATIGGERVTVVDLPGLYSLDGMSLEERGAGEYISRHKDSFLLFVCECSSLPRTLPLFAELAKDRRCALVLTKKKRFVRAGGRVDERGLERALGYPVFCAEGRVRALKEELARALKSEKREGTGEIGGCYRPPREEQTRAESLLTNGLICVPLFFALLALAFYLTFAPGLIGDVLKTAIEEFFTVTLGGLARRIPSPVVRSFVADGILGGVGSVLSFLPQIALLFLFLICMEESGFLSRLAVHTDGFFSRLGLNGRAMFSLLMGFGCSAAAILTTRGLDDKRIQQRVILCLPYVSCSAKLPVYLTLASSFFENPFLAVVLLYALGLGLAVAVALLMKREAPPFVMELAPLQIPSPRFVAKALFFQLKQFIIKLATVIFAFFLFSWLLSSFNWKFCFCGTEESMLASLCGGLKYLFAPIGCCDWKIAYAALSGLIAKENVAGALAMFYGGFPYSAESAFAFAVFILACSPCVSAIAASARELGKGRAVLNAVLQTGSALLLSYAVYFLLTGGWLVLPMLVSVVTIAIAGKNAIEKVSRKRRKLAEKIHR